MTNAIAEHRVETAGQAEAEAWLDQEHGTAQPDPAKFEILTIGAADWALRKVKRQQELLAAAEAQADEEIARWQAYKTLKRQECESRTQFLAIHIEEYARHCHDEGGPQTITLPSGKLSLRKQPASIEWPEKGSQEETALTTWAFLAEAATVEVRATGPDAIGLKHLASARGLNATVTYSRTAIKEHTQPGADTSQGRSLIDKDTGEVVPGVRYNPGGELLFSFR